MGRRETARFARRRKAWWCVQNGVHERAPLDAATGERFMRAVDADESALFGIARLCKLALDAPQPLTQKWVKRHDGGKLSLLRSRAARTPRRASRGL